MFVPVVDRMGKPLMPTMPSRARRWVKSGEATPFWNKGIWCIRLNRQPSGHEMQPIACGIDPGSKKEGFTIKSVAHTFLNVQADAVTWVKAHVTTRRMLRRSRRNRNCPYRQPRWANRARKNVLPPSTKARWQWKLRVVNVLRAIFPITDYVVEDVSAVTKKGHKSWNRSFSAIQHGKNWFYTELKKIGTLHLREGWQNKDLRDGLNVKKSTQKLSDGWDAHCVDSWVMCAWLLGGMIPENKAMVYYTPLEYHRRMLHRQNFQKGHVRSPYGSTRSMGFKRGSVINHPKYGVCYVGGTDGMRISVHRLTDGKRLSQKVKPTECTFVCFSSFRFRTGNGASSAA